jgi:hypothetical protein
MKETFIDSGERTLVKDKMIECVQRQPLRIRCSNADRRNSGFIALEA